jgi:hypothetical protein
MLTREFSPGCVERTLDAAFKLLALRDPFGFAQGRLFDSPQSHGSLGFAQDDND